MYIMQVPCAINLNLTLGVYRHLEMEDVISQVNSNKYNQYDYEKVILI